MKGHAITLAKKQYIQNSIAESKNDSRKIFNILNSFLGKSDKTNALPSHDSKSVLSNQFKDFFTNKINKIVDAFDNTVSLPHLIQLISHCNLFQILSLLPLK